MKGAQDIWTGILNKVCLVLATVAIAVVGATARGEYLLPLDYTMGRDSPPSIIISKNTHP